MKPLAQQIDLRITDADSLTLGLSYLDDGYAPTVGCTSPGCYMAANFMLYELRPGGYLRRACKDHAPSAWFDLVRSTTSALRALLIPNSEGEKG